MLSLWGHSHKFVQHCGTSLGIGFPILTCAQENCPVSCCLFCELDNPSYFTPYMPGNKEEAVYTHIPCGDKEQSPDCLDLLLNFMIKMEGCNKWVLHKVFSGGITL